jgi:hypothetical protein
MKSALEINGKQLAPIKAAAEATSYSRDYITRLAREEKIVASYIGRQWFVDVESLRRYAESTALDQEVRKRLLSDERKREQQLRLAVKQKHSTQMERTRKIPVHSLVASFLILGFGLTSGAFLYTVLPAHFSPEKFSLISDEVAQSVLATTANRMPAQTSGAAAVTRTTLAEQTPRTAIVTEQSLGDVSEGVLLLPAARGGQDVAELFSDTVAVRETRDGGQVVVLVDERGNQIGNPVPFVRVPVTASEI